MNVLSLLRHDFPILKQAIGGHSLTYLDNAATTQKPQVVLDAMVDFYSRYNANSYRGIYAIAEQATHTYEQVRAKIAQYIRAQDPSEIIFTHGATEGINAIAYGWGNYHIKAGDEILITQLEHHANILPWQRLAQEKGAVLKIIPVQEDGTLAMETLPHLITKKTKLIAVTQSSNAVGAFVDVTTIYHYAQQVNARLLVDAAQSVPHMPINVQELGADFLVFSGHKMLGPTGVGVLYIKKELHGDVEPYNLGGGIVSYVSQTQAQWLHAPHKFEAGTPPIAQVIGLGAAYDYLHTNVDFNILKKHESQLCTTLIDGLCDIKGMRILGPLEQLKKNGHLVSFTIDGFHAHDVAAYLNQFGICVRAGNHCAQPLAHALGYQASVRASFYLYNTLDEVKYMVSCLRDLVAKHI